MKRLNKVTASLLSVAALISVASCNGGSSDPGTGGNNGDNGSGEPAVTEAGTAETTTTATMFPAETYDTNVGVQNAVSEIKVDETLKPQKKLVFMGNWKIDNTMPAVELFKANYGIPEEGSKDYGQDGGDLVVVTRQVDWAARFDMLGAAIASGDAPDVFPFESQYFPLSAYKNMFQPIDGIIDMSGPEWDGWREVSDKFIWADKHYLAPIEFYPNEIMYYRRSVIENAGLDDPYELYKKGEWTWDTFLDMADKFQKSGNDRFVCDGWYTPDLIFCSTGVPIVGYENGKYVCNLYEPAVERAADLLTTLRKQGYQYDWANNGGVDESKWVSGNTLFWTDGFWFYQGNGHKYCEKNDWSYDEPDYQIEVNKKDENGKNVKDENGKNVKELVWVDYDDVMYVPAPRDPNADKYYHTYRTFGYALCTGSTNIDCFKAWTQCNIVCLNDPDVQAASRQQLMENEKWTEKQMELRELLYSVTDTPLTPVFDYRTGINTENAQQSNAPVDMIIKDILFNSEITFTGRRAEYGSQVSIPVDELNAELDKLHNAS